MATIILWKWWQWNGETCKYRSWRAAGDSEIICAASLYFVCYPSLYSFLFLPLFCMLSLFLFCFFIVIPTLHLLLLIVMTPFISHLLFLSSHHLACYPSLYFASAMSSNFICLICIFTFWFYSLLCPPLSNWTDKWKSMDTKSAAHIGASVDQLTHHWKILMRPHLSARLAFCSPSAAITCDIHHYHHYSPFSPFSPLSPLFIIFTIITITIIIIDQFWFIIISIIVMITFESAKLSK